MSQEEFDECIDNYKEVNSCSIEPPPQTDYGMPPVLSAEDAEACCGKDTESQVFKDCVKKMYESCPANMSTPQEEFDKCIENFKEINDCAPIMTLYGMPSPPNE